MARYENDNDWSSYAHIEELFDATFNMGYNGEDGIPPHLTPCPYGTKKKAGPERVNTKETLLSYSV